MEQMQQFNIRMPARVVKWIDRKGRHFLTEEQSRDLATGRRSLRAAVVLSLLEAAMKEG